MRTRPTIRRKSHDGTFLDIGCTLDGDAGGKPARAHHRFQLLTEAKEQQVAITEFETANAEVRAHRRTFVSFERLVLFAVMHVALVLACLALAFLGHIPVLAVLLGVGGTVALIAGFAIAGSQSPP
jgi:hypothetical protein